MTSANELQLPFEADPTFDVDSISAGRQDVHQIPVISLFTGAGLLDLGFEQAGFRIVYRNEIDRVFAASNQFAWNAMGHSQSDTIDVGSIVDIGPKALLRRAFGGSGIPNVFGMIGGPPCPDFSIGGKNRGHKGERGRLTELYVSRILECLPTFFVFENVKGLVSTRKHLDFLLLQERRLAEKYAISRRVLNALDFGVPQDRERVFLIGFRRQRRSSHFSNNGCPFAWPRSRRYYKAKDRYDWPRANAFEGSVAPPPGIPVELTVWHAIGDLKHTNLPNGRDCFLPRSDKFNSIREGDDRRKSFKRLHRWRYSPTVAYGNNEVHLHPVEPRRITVREAMRLQTVPDSYAFPPEVPLSAKYKMVGNAVPVRLANCVALSIANHLTTTSNGCDDV